MTARCELTDLEVTGCAHCKGIPDTPPAADRNLGPVFTASYEGNCSECGRRFHVLERIRADGDGGYLGECCGEAA